MLEEWGIHGEEREELVAKVKVLVAENNRYDREAMEKLQAKREAERSQAPPPRR